jgi:hypothetical protein
MRRVIWLQTATVFWLGGSTISLCYWMYMGLTALDKQEIHTAEPLVPELSVFDVQLAIEKVKSHKSPGIDQIPAELIKAGGRTICYEIHKLINSIWNKELSGEYESILSPIYKKGAKTDYSERHITFVHYLQNFIQHPAVKLNSTCRGNNWRSSVWISTQ